MKPLKTFLIPIVLVCWGCSDLSSQDKMTNAQKTVPSSREEGALSSVSFQPFFVFSDKASRKNHFVPSGFMPNAQCLKFNDRWDQDCQSGDTCIRIVYDLACSMKDQNWSGIYWLNPPNNWGKRKGGFDLRGATRLTFWAKGEKGGERIEEFKIGGIDGDFPDTDMAMIGPVILTNEWREYSIDLRGKDLSYISGGFSWATNVDANIQAHPEECVFYLDNIRYE